MKPDWVKYGEIYIDGKFNQMVVCIGCHDVETVFMDLKAYWEHVEQNHWRKYDSRNTHRDFKKAAESSKKSSNIIDLTESDDEGEINNENVDLSVDKIEIKEEKLFDEIEAQLSRMDGEGSFKMTFEAEKEQFNQVHRESNMPSTQEVQAELQTFEAVSSACANIPTPEASPVGGPTSCPFSSGALATITQTTNDTNSLLEELQHVQTSKKTNENSGDIKKNSSIYGRIPSKERNDKQLSAQTASPLLRPENGLTVSIPLQQLGLPLTANKQKPTYAEYKQIQQQKLIQQEQQKIRENQGIVERRSQNISVTTKSQQQQQQYVNSSLPAATAASGMHLINSASATITQYPNDCCSTITQMVQQRSQAYNIENTPKTTYNQQQRQAVTFNQPNNSSSSRMIAPIPWQQQNRISARRNTNIENIPKTTYNQPQRQVGTFNQQNISSSSRLISPIPWQQHNRISARRNTYSSQMFKCQHCPNKPILRSVESYEQHQNRFHNPQHSNKETFYCNTCERSFMKWCSKNHYQTMTHLENEKKRQNQASNPGPIRKRRKTFAGRLF